MPHGEAFTNAARTVCGAALAEQLKRDILFLQDVGLERLQPQTVERLKQRYGTFDHRRRAGK